MNKNQNVPIIQSADEETKGSSTLNDETSHEPLKEIQSVRSELENYYKPSKPRRVIIRARVMSAKCQKKKK